jgi:hypothetical protein
MIMNDLRRLGSQLQQLVHDPRVVVHDRNGGFILRKRTSQKALIDGRE